MASKKKPTPFPAPVYPYVVESFFDPRRTLHTSDDPSCFNGQVSVERYRITIEKIEEPLEIIHERLRKLYRETDNHHHWAPIRAEAKRLGLDIGPHAPWRTED